MLKSCTCEPIAHTLVLDLPDAGGLNIDIPDSSQLMRELYLLGAEANGMRVLRTQRLWLAIHLHQI